MPRRKSLRNLIFGQPEERKTKKRKKYDEPEEPKIKEPKESDQVLEKKRKISDQPKEPKIIRKKSVQSNEHTEGPVRNLIPITSSLEASIIDTTENVGIQVDRNQMDFNEDDLFDESNFSIGLHPCICCNVSLRTGIRILSIIEIVHWGVLFVFCIGSLIYWFAANSPQVQIGDELYTRNNSENSKLLQNVLITYTLLCGAFLALGVSLLIGAQKVTKTIRPNPANPDRITKMNRNFISAWLYGTLGLEIIRMIVAILFAISAIRYGLFYWFMRAYEFWAIISYSNKLRKESGDTEKRHRFQFRWRRKKTRDGQSLTVFPTLVPITYYGVFKKDSTANVVGYELDDPDFKSKVHRHTHEHKRKIEVSKDES